MDLKSIAENLNDKIGATIAFVGDEREPVTAVSTGILPLDVAIGIGGLPRGRIVEVHGLFSTGKTSLCLAIIASFQKQGLRCAYIDAEYCFSYEHAQSFGVKTDELLLLQTDTGEQAFSAMEKLIKDKNVDLIVVDSVSALVPLPDAEADHGKSQIGAQAKLISKGLAKIVAPVHKNGAIIIFINQLRQNIMGGQYDPYILPGGMALRFYTSLMLEIHRKGAITQGDEQVGIQIEIKVKKNKVGRPNEKCEAQLFFDKGFSAEADTISMAEKMEVIKVKGNTYYFGEEKLGVGQKKARKFLESNPEIMAKIKDLLTSPQSK